MFISALNSVCLPIRHEQSGEESATPGKLVEEHKELVLK
jgi:hypothetical protein